MTSSPYMRARVCVCVEKCIQNMLFSNAIINASLRVNKGDGTHVLLEWRIRVVYAKDE